MAKKITVKIKNLYEEIFSARNMVVKILSVLYHCDSDTNLTENIDICILQIPDFKILSDEKLHAISVLREVCTAETTIEEAIEIFLTAKEDLEYALTCFNPKKFMEIWK